MGGPCENCAWFTTFGLLGFACGLLYLFFVWNFGSWKKRGISEAKSYPFLGTFPSGFTQRRNVAYDVDDVYRKFRDTDNFVGVFSSRTPQLLILSPEYIHKIYVNDFKNFHDNEFASYVDEETDVIMANNPFMMTGEKWKERRNEITPGMTMNRIKNAYPVTQTVCKRLRQFIKEQIKMSDKNGVDTNDLCLRYTSEVVTDCVLGIQADSLTANPTPILAMIKTLFDISFAFAAYSFVVSFLPVIKKVVKMRVFPRKAESFFFSLMQQSIDLRRAQGNDRVDFLNYLLQLQDKKKLSTPEMTSNVMTFLTDGFLTTASVIAHCLLLLARDQDRQEKLRQEILKHLDKNDELSFEDLHELPYLDACLHEALRIFSPLTVSAKVCTSSYEFVNKNGKILKVSPGEIVMIPAYSVHHDAQYYEEPEEFRPERFLPENGGGIKSYRERGLYLGFGDGPRVCLGMKFALTQAKAAIVEIIKNFNIKVNPKTRSDNNMNPKSFLSELTGGVWLNFEERS